MSRSPGRWVQPTGNFRNFFYESLIFYRKTAVTRPGQFFPKSTHPEVMFKKKIMSIGFRSSEINSLKVGDIPSFWGALWVQNAKQWGKSLQNSPSREWKYTFSEHAKDLYRARKRVCRARMALETS